MLVKTNYLLIYLYLVFAATCQAATYYVDVANGNNGNTGLSSGQAWATIAHAQTQAVAGDVVNLMPTGYYPASTWDDTMVGNSADGYITWQGDPGTISARDSTWYTTKTGIDDPCETERVVFHGPIDIDRVGSGSTPTGTYLRFKHIAVVLPHNSEQTHCVRLSATQKAVEFISCDFLGGGGETATQMTEYGVWFRHLSGGSKLVDVLFKNCLIQEVHRGFYINSGIGTGNQFIGCNLTRLAGSSVMFTTSGEPEGQTVFDGCRLSHREKKATSLKYDALEVNAPGSPATTTFTIRFTEPPYLTKYLGGGYIMKVTDATDSSYAYRVIDAYDPCEVTLREALPFSVEAGDAIECYDVTHGSGFSLRDPCVTIQNTIIHDVGGTGSIYTYSPDVYRFDNIILKNNLIYGGQNLTLAEINLEGNCEIINNTFLGQRHPTVYPGQEEYKYGNVVLRFSNDLADSPNIVANNIFACRVGATEALPASAVCVGNIAWYFQTTGVSPVNNVILYNDEAYPSDPCYFEYDEEFFIFTESKENINGYFWNQSYGLIPNTYRELDLDDQFYLHANSEAIAAADTDYIPATDLNGNAHGDDAGCFSFDSGVPGGDPPTAPTSLQPNNGSVGMSISPTLSWEDGGGADNYDVFLGTSNPPVTEVSTAQTGTAYAASGLSQGTTYYWFIRANNSYGTSDSSVFNFTTSPASSPGGKWLWRVR